MEEVFLKFKIKFIFLELVQYFFNFLDVVFK